VLAGHDFSRRKIYGIKAGGAKPVDLNAWNLVAKACDQCRRPRNISACFTDWINAAKHNVVDQRGIELVAVLDPGERLSGEIERSHFMQ
jgi:hypothetical protein